MVAARRHETVGSLSLAFYLGALALQRKRSRDPCLELVSYNSLDPLKLKHRLGVNEKLRYQIHSTVPSPYPWFILYELP